MSGGLTGGSRWPQFTTAQWQELEHQALIFKYLKAGLCVPPDLLAPIHRSFESMSIRYLQYPTLGCYSNYGKKIDQEPGRCRRSDGKKWRCSKDAHPDSKYCERHMNRGRQRSRKPVESQTASQSGPTATLNVGVGVGSSNGSRISQNLPTNSNSVNLSFGRHSLDTTPYGICNTYRSEPKAESETNKAVLQAAVGVKGIDMKPPMVDSHKSTSQSPADLQLDLGHGIGDYSYLQNEQHYFFGNSHGTELDRTSRPFLYSQRSDMNSFSSTQLSMGIDRDVSPKW